MSYLRKTISFNAEIQREQNVYDILDRVRYRQSDFIIKLLEDFFRKNNIRKDTPYSYLKMVVKTYLDNSLPENNIFQPQPQQIGMNELMQLYLPALLQQMQSVGNMPMGNPILQVQNKSLYMPESVIQTPEPNIPAPVKEKVDRTYEVQDEIKPQEYVHEESGIFTNDDDEVEDISDLQGIAMGFQSLLD